MAKKSRRKVLIDKLDSLWSKSVRRLYPRCVVCGKDYGLSSHHCIKRKGQSVGVRWLLNNGITLCWDCHFHYVHGNRADKVWLDKYIELLNRLIPIDEQEKIIRIAGSPTKFSMDDLERLVKSFKEKL